MVSAHAGIEALLVFVGIATFSVYHLWTLKLRQKFTKDPYWHGYFQAGKMARLLWAQACMQSSAQGILAVQTIRNAEMAVSFLATIQGILFTVCIQLVFDQGKMNRISRLIKHDPIADKADGPPLLPATAVVAIGIAVLFTSFVCLAQSIRLYVHLGFMITAVASQQDEVIISKDEATSLAIRAGVSYSIGLRVFYLYIIVLAWCVGPTYVMICGLLMTAVLHHLDSFKPKALVRRGKATTQSSDDLAGQRDLPKSSSVETPVAHLAV